MVETYTIPGVAAFSAPCAIMRLALEFGSVKLELESAGRADTAFVPVWRAALVASLLTHATGAVSAGRARFTLTENRTVRIETSQVRLHVNRFALARALKGILQ